jgi:hypothetical protein
MGFFTDILKKTSDVPAEFKQAAEEFFAPLKKAFEIVNRSRPNNHPLDTPEIQYVIHAKSGMFEASYYGEYVFQRPPGKISGATVNETFGLRTKFSTKLCDYIIDADYKKLEATCRSLDDEVEEFQDWHILGDRKPA